MASVPAGDEVESALVIMRREGIHLVEVRDEIGASVGVLFLEDILEELVGEVRVFDIFTGASIGEGRKSALR